MTFDIDEFWSITVSHAAQIAPNWWRATAQAYRRDTETPVGECLEGFGSTMDTADTAAQRKAEAFIASQDHPQVGDHAS